MINTKKRYRGFTFTELTVALAVLGIILAALAMSLKGFSKFNKYLLTKQHCICAASAVLDGVTATGQILSREDIQRLWPDVSITTQTANGTDQWEGLKLINVTAIGKMPRKEVKIEMSRYVLPRQEK